MLDTRSPHWLVAPMFRVCTYRFRPRFLLLVRPKSTSSAVNLGYYCGGNSMYQRVPIS